MEVNGLERSSSRTSSICSDSQTESLMCKISDAGLYSLCGLVAISFHDLFEEEHYRKFREEKMGELLQYFGLSSRQIENSMKAMMDGEGGSANDLAELLKEEALLKFSCIRVIEELVMYGIRGGTYDARLRVLILHVATCLNVPHMLVQLYEESLIDLLSSSSPPSEEAQRSEQQQLAIAKKSRNKKIKRYFMIGLVGLSGGALMGLTGGLAAPLVAAGAGAIIGGTSAAVLGSTTGIAIIGSLFGVAGAGLTGYKMKKRVGDIEEFAFDEMSNGKELHITIAVSGWVSEQSEDAFTKPWGCLNNTREQYAVRYESTYLLEMGRALEYFIGFAMTMAAQEALKFTILSGIMAAIAWPATLVTFANVIDNPWSVCIRRSAEVGKHLATVLLARQQGRRPVSLVGFSLGARVIFHCLTELAQHPGSEGIVQDAILLGAPVSGSLDQWRALSKVVSGRIVNGYSKSDWLLKFLYRTSTASIKIAGLDAIDWKDRRMQNVDLSDIINGHLDYYKKLAAVLQKVGVPVERNASSSIMRKCVSGIPPVSSHQDGPTIRMSISDPSFARWFYPNSQYFNTLTPEEVKDDRWFNHDPTLYRSNSAESVLKKYNKRLTTSITSPDLRVAATTECVSFNTMSTSDLSQTEPLPIPEESEEDPSITEEKSDLTDSSIQDILNIGAKQDRAKMVELDPLQLAKQLQIQR